MAYVEISREPGDSLQVLGPLTLRHNLGTVVSFAWWSKGPRGNDPAFVRDVVNGVADDAMEWWADLPTVQKMVGNHATKGLDCSGGNLGDNARMMMRQSVQHCWMMLPLPRRSNEEVRRLIDRMLDELFIQLQADFAEFRRT